MTNLARIICLFLPESAGRQLKLLNWLFRLTGGFMTDLKLANELVIPFESLRMHHVDIVGGKNASLGEMISQLPHGVKVPTGFATTAHAFRLFLKHENLDQRIEQALANLDADNISMLTETGRKIIVD